MQRNPKSATCFDMSLEGLKESISRKDACDILGRDLYHGDIIKFVDSYKNEYFVYVVDGQDELLDDRSYAPGIFNVPIEVSEKLVDVFSHYRYFKYESIALSRNDLHIQRIFTEPRHDNDIWNNGKFTAYKKIRNVGDCVNLDYNRDPIKFYLSVEYKECVGMFAYFENDIVDQGKIEAYFVTEIKKKETKANGFITLTFEHDISYTSNDGNISYKCSRPFQDAEAIKRAFPSDKWTIIDSTAKSIVVQGHRTEICFFNMNLS